MEVEGTSYNRIDEDMYTVLADKTEGEAASRGIRGCEPGQGVKEYMRIYKWFTSVSGQAVTDRMKTMMSPGVPKGVGHSQCDRKVDRVGQAAGRDQAGL